MASQLRGSCPSSLPSYLSRGRKDTERVPRITTIYRAWQSTYADGILEASTSSLGPSSLDRTRRGMPDPTPAPLMEERHTSPARGYEFMFWSMAYNLEVWLK